MDDTAAFDFEPYSKKQLKAVTWWMHHSPYNEHDGIIADGSIRSGKTIAFIDGFVEWSRNTFYDENFIISSKSMGALKRNIINPLKKILTAKGIKYDHNRSDNWIKFGGNSYYFFGASNEASQDVLQGLTAAGWLGDEVSLYPQSFVDQAIGRCSVKGRKLWLNCNPASPYHYIKTDIIDKAPEKRFLRLHFNLDDNPTLDPEIKAGYERMYSGVWYKRMILGLWVAAEGAIYDMFDTDKHVIDPSLIPSLKNYALGFDWGTTHPTAASLIGWNDRNDIIYQVGEYYYKHKEGVIQKTLSQIVRGLSDFVLPVMPKNTYCDPSFPSARTEMIQHDTLVRTGKINGTIFNPSPADNSVIEGICFMQELFSANRFLISSICKRSIEQYTSYVWDRKQQQKGIDRPIKIDDDLPDSGRYACYTALGKSNLTEWKPQPSKPPRSRERAGYH